MMGGLKEDSIDIVIRYLMGQWAEIMTRAEMYSESVIIMIIGGNSC